MEKTGVGYEQSLSSFGEERIVTPTPVVQIDAVYGIRQNHVTEVLTDGSSGSADVYTGTNGNEYRCQTGTSVGGYGVIRSLRAAKYRPGQGTTFRFTARFSTPVLNSIQRAGAIGIGNELSFGYNIDGNFGILYRRGGAAEIRTITFTVGAGGAETGTVTLNGTAFTLSLTAGNTAHLAFQVATVRTYTGYDVYSNGSTCIFMARSVGAQTGTFSFSSTGTAAGSFAQTKAGAAVVDDWIYKDSFNRDKLDGTGPSMLNIDPTKGNVYQIQKAYLGYGTISYQVMHPKSGQFITVHTLEYPNSSFYPNLSQPYLKVGLFAASLGSTTNVTCYGASAAAFIDGQLNQSKNPEGFSHSKTGIGTSWTAVFSIRVRNVFNAQAQLGELYPKFFTAAAEGTKPVEIGLYIDATLGGEPDWTYQDEDNSIAEYDTAATTVAANADSHLISVISLGKSGQAQINLSGLEARLWRNQVITVAAKATSGTADVIASLTWNED